MRFDGNTRLRLLPCLLIAACLAGCGGDGLQLVQVNGTVTLDGQPLVGAAVIFHPDGGRPSVGETDSEGRYSLKYTVDFAMESAVATNRR